jgi:Kef-type K+ transport system membrane component KefB
MLLQIKPITDPVAIFAVIIVVILFIPYLSKKIKIPSIFGLIVAGLIIGPNGTGLLPANESISVISAVGLLYIMFLAGLEINNNTFLKNKNKSLIFGLATFLLPLGIGFPILYYFLHYPFLPALLISSMFSTHTLLSYPIASKLNITRRESVVISIGGTIFTDTAVLILLTVITTAHLGKLTGLFWLQLVLSVIVFVFVVLWGLPKIARWYFTTIQSDSTSQYIFVLVALFLSALLGKLAGIEPIVGAFLSGLALNRVIPHHSPVMNRTVFIGNALFIPFFLISVGMLIDIKLLFSGFETIILAAILISIAIAGKYAAAFFTQIIFKYTRSDRNLIFGLSSAHAAATIAVILRGYQLQILDEKVLNGTILLILATSMISTFFTEHAARDIAVEETDLSTQLSNGPERILVPIANPASIEKLIDIATLARQLDTETVIYPLFIVDDGDDAQSTILNNHKIKEQLLQHGAATETSVNPITRLDINIPACISRTAKELLATKIIMGWSGRSYTANYFFGNIIDNLLENTQQLVMVVRVKWPIAAIKNIYVMVPTNADKELGFYSWVNSVIGLSKNTGGKIVFMTDLATIAVLKKRLNEFKIFTASNFLAYEYYPNISVLPVDFTSNDIVIAIAARPATISFNRRQLILPKLISKFPDNRNFIVIYPEYVEKLSPIEMRVESFDRV